MAAGDGGGDIFREAHKGVRNALFGVTALVGRANGADDASVQHVEHEWRDVATVLDLHQQFEDQYSGPLIREHAGYLADDIAKSHHELDEAIDRIDVIVGRLVAAPPARRPALLGSLYTQLAEFLPAYLTHLNHEEALVLPALHQALGPGGLARAAGQMHRGMGPDDLCIFIRYLVPGMNPPERVELLHALREVSTPEVFEQVRMEVQICLTAEEYGALAEATGLV